MRNSGYFLSYVDGLRTSFARSFLASTHARFYKELEREMSKKAILRKLSARLPWFTEIYKKKLPCIFQAANEVMFFLLVAYKTVETEKPFFCNTFISVARPDVLLFLLSMTYKISNNEFFHAYIF